MNRNLLQESGDAGCGGHPAGSTHEREWYCEWRRHVPLLLCCRWCRYSLLVPPPSCSAAHLVVQPATALLPFMSGTESDVVPASSRHTMKAVCFDANAKANRYKLAGRSGAYDDVPQTMNQFLGTVNDQVWCMKAEGPLPVAPSKQHSHAADEADTIAADDLDLELDGKCHPKLSCARESSLQSSISDVCGLVGAVCSHGQPLLGMFIAMPAPERFLYYDLLLDRLLTETEVSIMYLDTGCTYSKHLNLYGGDGDPRPKYIKVPWWHAIGHRSDCFLVNSGMYLPGGLQPLCAMSQSPSCIANCQVCKRKWHSGMALMPSMTQCHSESMRCLILPASGLQLFGSVCQLPCCHTCITASACADTYFQVPPAALVRTVSTCGPLQSH